MPLKQKFKVNSIKELDSRSPSQQAIKIPPPLLQKDKATLRKTTHRHSNITKNALDHIVKQEDEKLLTHQELNAIIQRSEVFPKDVPIKKDMGKLNLMCPSGKALLHQAAPLLQFYSDDGCPCDCGPNWTPEHILAAIK
jgi:hypothetical protein